MWPAHLNPAVTGEEERPGAKRDLPPTSPEDEMNDDFPKRARRPSSADSVAYAPPFDRSSSARASAPVAFSGGGGFSQASAPVAFGGGGGLDGLAPLPEHSWFSFPGGVGAGGPFGLHGLGAPVDLGPMRTSAWRPSLGPAGAGTDEGHRHKRPHVGEAPWGSHQNAAWPFAAAAVAAAEQTSPAPSRAGGTGLRPSPTRWPTSPQPVPRGALCTGGGGSGGGGGGGGGGGDVDYAAASFALKQLHLARVERRVAACAAQHQASRAAAAGGGGGHFPAFGHAGAAGGHHAFGSHGAAKVCGSHTPGIRATSMY